MTEAGNPTHSRPGRVSRRRSKPEPGTLSWNGKVWRRWDGRRWRHALYSRHPDRLVRPEGFDREPQLSKSSRDRVLALAVEDQVATHAATVVHHGPNGVVLGYRRPTSNGLHAVLTVLTLGTWAIVWLAVAVGRREDRLLLEIDPWGNVWAKRVRSA